LCGAGRTLARPVWTVGFTGCNRGPAGGVDSATCGAVPAAEFGSADESPGGWDPALARGAEVSGSAAGTGVDACSGPPCVSPTAPSSSPAAILGQTT